MAFNLKKKRENTVNKVSNLFDSLFAEYNLTQEISLDNIKSSWDHLAGAVLSIHTIPVSLEDNVLKVVSDHSVYTSDLQSVKYSIIKKINSQFGTNVENISVIQKRNRFKK